MAEIRDAQLDDLDRVFDLLAARDRAAIGLAEVTRADLGQWWDTPGLERFVTDGGYGALDAVGEFDVVGAHSEAMLALIAERARERGLPLLTAIVVDGDEPLDALVRGAGFEPRGAVLRMWRMLDGPLPEPLWPDGISVRTYEPADARAVKDLLDEAYLAWDDTYVPRPLEVWTAWMTDHGEFDPGLWFLAERDATLVACALHWRVHQNRGWLKDIAVRTPERGTGLGKALLSHALREYAARSADRVGLKVDSTNPTGAVQLYEHMGFDLERRYGIWVKQL